MDINIGIACLLFMIAGFLMGKLTKPIKISIVTTDKEEVPTPTIKVPNPMQAYKEHKQKEMENEELERLERIIDNIENYDGTGANQKDV